MIFVIFIFQKLLECVCENSCFAGQRNLSGWPSRGPSTTWANYRHQADAFAMYQLLRQSGYDDDHIILIIEDNLASNPQNVYPGQIFIERTSAAGAGDALANDDVRKGAVVDYHFSDLRREDIADILMGKASSRLPHVIRPDSASNVSKSTCS